MELKYIDIHTHPFKEYYDDPYQIVSHWKTQDMEKLFIVGTSKEDSVELLELCNKDKDFLYPIIGIHPTLATGKKDGDFLESIINEEVIGIGEIGLDYHYDDSPSKEIQYESFIAQLEVAKKHNIVAMLHIRDALDDAFEIITRPEYKDLKIVMHSFSGDLDFVKRVLPFENIYFSISGVVTFKNAKPLQEAVLNIPIERMFCETDTPYLAPTPMRGKPNISPYVKYTYQYIANLKNLSEEEFVTQIRKNIKKVFGI
ncbi:TatD family hydrolase [Mycoplasmopsis arginini]|uniref:TatD family hydrolase n=1 Tax=Mycoplasmopsis arginini TaxID=2094 RepID=UPI00249EB1DE|nr:TatD family hydrolase [Mycoplasmopsis arginini]MDI3348597.1 TatD family hydrolase [Mycoplasmopsis arginini]MDI3348912.1 TatD family hydrolase [Mycoplasmopsis arginini]MDI3351629.1 TatD family hydrolase [Mycoplasmopsis arginini]MDI3352166.1 TatD family hydrolase [Mycoplasmopsis arginini]